MHSTSTCIVQIESEYFIVENYSLCLLMVLSKVPAVIIINYEICTFFEDRVEVFNFFNLQVSCSVS
jgi:hypothetical protein